MTMAGRIASTFKSYQAEAHKTAMYPIDGPDAGLSYCLLKLCGEVGELAQKWGKIIRDKGGFIDESDRLEMAKELGDCQWYIAETATVLKLDLEAIAEGNILKLRARKETGKIGGSGDNR